MKERVQNVCFRYITINGRNKAELNNFYKNHKINTINIDDFYLLTYNYFVQKEL